MLWFISLVLCALINTSLSIQIRSADSHKKEPNSNCTEYFINHDEYQLDTGRIPGVWYQVTDHPELIFCLDFKSLNDENRQKIAAELKQNSNITDLSRFSLIVKRRFPGVNYNNTEFHLLAQHGDKGVFDIISEPPRRTILSKTQPTTIKMKLYEADNDTYMLLEDSERNCLLMTQKPNKHLTEDKIKTLLSNAKEIRPTPKHKH